MRKLPNEHGVGQCDFIFQRAKTNAVSSRLTHHRRFLGIETVPDHSKLQVTLKKAIFGDALGLDRPAFAISFVSWDIIQPRIDDADSTASKLSSNPQQRPV
jgi:hypothetical protein